MASFSVMASVGTTLMGFVLSAVAVLLILLILVQRGRGGGLAGALGGMGGSSAFGAKAGDVFTKITAYAAFGWILLCLAAAKMGAPSGASRISTGVNTTTHVEGSADDAAQTDDARAAGDSAAGDSAAGDSAAGGSAAEADSSAGGSEGTNGSGEASGADARTEAPSSAE